MVACASSIAVCQSTHIDCEIMRSREAGMRLMMMKRGKDGREREGRAGQYKVWAQSE